jgi:hypothetical protein
MRRESSTIVVLIGDADDALLAGLNRSPNVSVARAPAIDGLDADGAGPASARPGWEPGALAMREAARRRSTYVVVPHDPLADVAAGWRAMWDVSSGPAGPAGFELSAAEALAAWHDKRFELPDYYLVAEAVRADGADDAGPDMYLGPLRAMRPRRVAVAGIGALGAGVADATVRTIRIIEALRALEHGPWWPPLDDLLDAIRNFYAGGVTETQLML